MFRIMTLSLDNMKFGCEHVNSLNANKSIKTRYKQQIYKNNKNSHQELQYNNHLTEVTCNNFLKITQNARSS